MRVPVVLCPPRPLPEALRGLPRASVLHDSDARYPEHEHARHLANADGLGSNPLERSLHGSTRERGDPAAAHTSHVSKKANAVTVAGSGRPRPAYLSNTPRRGSVRSLKYHAQQPTMMADGARRDPVPNATLTANMMCLQVHVAGQHLNHHSHAPRWTTSHR
jgi:hypothetical protein